MLELAKILLPALVVALAMVAVVALYFKQMLAQRDRDLAQRGKELTLPLRTQAYERLILFLERCTLAQLMLRLPAEGYSVAGYAHDLIAMVNQEFEHNLSQQLYVGDLAWQQVVQAKNEAIDRIVTARNELNQEALAYEMVGQLLDRVARQGDDHGADAIRMLKKEAARLWGQY
jgi:hypothetical protein